MTGENGGNGHHGGGGGGKKKRRRIKLEYLARVEGEGTLDIQFADGELVDAKLKIFEPPRFFEALLRGRAFTEAPDITARICGICPVAYQMSAVHAMERIAGVTLPEPLRELRRLLYCGEWIESHTLHVYMLHAPDFLGYPDAIRLAKDHPDAVKRGLRLKKAGNAIVNTLGGREIHPINVKVGGFYRAPSKTELRELLPELEWAREAAADTVRWVATLDFPDFEPDYEFVALRHPSEYPFSEGRIASTTGLDIDNSAFFDHFEEEHVEHSTALHCIHKGRGHYMVGPMARYNLNFDRLSPTAQAEARAAGLGEICRNPFKSIIVRAVEILWACEEAIRVIENYARPDEPSVEVKPRAGVGHGATEAPRGVLYHRYEINDAGEILDAKIVPPTSQNQKTIESDLRELVAQNAALPDDQLQHRCEQGVRNYDPCISCSTHFLKMNIRRD
jgi:coenzyme F420-reducing hydrogenase alpha subunit